MIEIKNYIELKHSDIENLSEDDFINNNNFLKYLNNDIIKTYYKNRDIINQVFNITEILKKFTDKENINSEKEYQVVLPPEVWEKLRSGDYQWVKSAIDKDLLTALIKDKSGKEIITQIKLKEVFSNKNIDGSLQSLHLAAIQSNLRDINNALLEIDLKLGHISQSLYNDRLSIITSGYNLFLQARVYKEDNNKIGLLTHSISQLNLGRESLIKDIEQDIEIFSKFYISRFGRFYQSFFSNHDIVKNQKEHLNKIKKSLLYVIRASQLVAVIYQDIGECKAMHQSLARLSVFLQLFNKAEVVKKLCAWDTSTSNIDFWEKIVPELIKKINNSNKELSAKHEIKIFLNNNSNNEEKSEKGNNDRDYNNYSEAGRWSKIVLSVGTALAALGGAAFKIAQEIKKAKDEIK